MSNFSLPDNSKLFLPIAKYKLITSYDSKGTKFEYKNDLGLYKIGLSDSFLENLMSNDNLKTVDLRVVSYILHSIVKDSDIVTLNPTIIMRYINKNRSTISASIKRLCQEQYIMATTGRGSGRCTYEINLNYFFRGNRIDLLETIDTKLIERIS